MKISDRLNQQASLLHERAGDIAALEREHERLRDVIRELADKYHNADAEQPGAVVRADTFEVELRALLDGE